jgi:antitoxin component YwqK of YwqJK toxin-antitoxin module
MRKQKLLLLILTIAFGQSFGQSDGATVYKGLQTKEYYSILLSPQEINGKVVYKANGKEVSKFIYDKYHSKYKNMETCCPCILKSYDENDVLLREEVSCTDCRVGWFKIYYSNGKVKLAGQYKENPTGNWENIYERGFCNIPEGEWSYFNENGDKLYSEFWKDGVFIKQIPEQKKTEIWRVELTLKGEKIDKQALTANEVKEIIVTPKFKNSHKFRSQCFRPQR